MKLFMLLVFVIISAVFAADPAPATDIKKPEEAPKTTSTSKAEPVSKPDAKVESKENPQTAQKVPENVISTTTTTTTTQKPAEAAANGTANVEEPKEKSSTNTTNSTGAHEEIATTFSLPINGTNTDPGKPQENHEDPSKLPVNGTNTDPGKPEQPEKNPDGSPKLPVDGQNSTQTTEKPKNTTTNSAIRKHPYLASICTVHKNKLCQFSCGAAILSHSFVITAAHCLGNHTEGQLRVRVASSWNMKSGKLHQVDEGFKHPKFGKKLKKNVNDVAILRLKVPIIFGVNVRAVPLPKRQLFLREGVSVNITGWDMPLKNKNNSSLLISKEYKKITNDECLDRFEQNANWGQSVLQSAFCVVSEDNLLKAGHAGDPVVAFGRLYGIVSWTENTKNLQPLPVVVSNINDFRDFISESTAI